MAAHYPPDYTLVHRCRQTGALAPLSLPGVDLTGPRMVVLARFRDATGWTCRQKIHGLGFLTVPTASLA